MLPGLLVVRDPRFELIGVDGMSCLDERGDAEESEMKPTWLQVF